MPAAKGLNFVQAPLAHCWYELPTQLNMPSEVQGPDRPPEVEPELAEPVPAGAGTDAATEAVGTAEVRTAVVLMFP